MTIGIEKDSGKQTSRPMNVGTLTQSFVYYGWTEQVAQVGQGARLKYILAAVGSKDLQNLHYTYNAVGNIISLVKMAHRGVAIRKAQTLQPQ